MIAPVYDAARTSERFQVRDELVESRLASVFDANLARDPNYPDRQLVRSSYLAPVDEALERPTFVRVREYLGAVRPDGPSGPRAAFLELKDVLEDGRKVKQRIAVGAGLLEQLASDPTGATLRSSVAGGEGASIAERAATLLDATPHVLEAPTEYGRLAWQDADGLLRISLDRVAPEGVPLAGGVVERRVLEVKHVTGEVPAWLSIALGDAIGGDALFTLRRGSTPGPVEDAARAAMRVLGAVR